MMPAMIGTVIPAISPPLAERSKKSRLSKKSWGADVIRAGVRLGLQVVHLDQSVRRFRMPLGESRPHRYPWRKAPLTNATRSASVGESPFRLPERRLPFRRVPPQSHDVVNPVFPVLAQKSFSISAFVEPTHVMCETTVSPVCSRIRMMSPCVNSRVDPPAPVGHASHRKAARQTRSTHGLCRAAPLPRAVRGGKNSKLKHGCCCLRRSRMCMGPCGLQVMDAQPDVTRGTYHSTPPRRKGESASRGYTSTLTGC